MNGDVWNRALTLMQQHYARETERAVWQMILFGEASLRLFPFQHEILKDLGNGADPTPLDRLPGESLTDDQASKDDGRTARHIEGHLPPVTADTRHFQNL